MISQRQQLSVTLIRVILEKSVIAKMLLRCVIPVVCLNYKVG